MDSFSLISGLSVIAFKKAIASRLTEQFAHDYGPMRYYKRTSECFFRQRSRLKVEFGSCRNSGKSPYSDRTVDLAILEVMPIQAFPESIS